TTTNYQLHFSLIFRSPKTTFMRKITSLLLLPFLLLQGLRAQTPADTKIPYGNNPAAGNYYTVRGFKMYCETYGKGQPLLIIHGNGGSIKDFTGQIPYFSEHYQVIIADSRAQGKSADSTTDSLSYEMMADD